MTVTAAGDSVYQPSTTSQLISIGKGTPSLVFTSLDKMAVLSSQTATVSSTVLNGGGTVTFSVVNNYNSSSGLVSLGNSPINNLVTSLNVGQVLLTASSSGDTNYYASSISQTLTIFQAPGGVSNGIRLWLRADSGVSPTLGNLSRWDDQSNSITMTSNQAAAVGGASPDIVLNPVGLNYNPVVTFSGANSKELRGVGDFSFAGGSSNTIVAVARNVSTNFCGIFASTDNWNGGMNV